MNDRAAVPGADGSGGPRLVPPTGGKAEGDFRALAENLPGIVARLDRGLALLYLNRAAREDLGPAPWPWWPPLRAAAARVFDTHRPQRWGFETVVGSERRCYAGRLVPELRGATFDTVLGVAVEADTATPDPFLGAVAHELRTPLNAIKSWTHVLENHLREGDPAAQRALAGIMVGVEQQVRLIEELLEANASARGEKR